MTFENLKDKLMSALVLAILNDSRPFRIERNASNFAIGGVLLQQQEEIWKVITYRSASLMPVE